MKFNNPPTYTVKQIENRAIQLLAEQLGQELTIPVDVELILERLDGVFFDIWPGLRGNHSVEGMVCRDTQTGEICVFIDDLLADNNPNRYRMTVAEELGHVILHRSVIEQVEQPRDFLELQRHQLWYEMDRNAKRYAAAVLMPRQQVVAYAEELYPRLVAVAGFGHVQAVQNQLVARLATRFEVSRQTMEIRLREWPVQVTGRVQAAMQDCLRFLG